MITNIKKTIGGLFFLILSLVYGWNALHIQLFSSVVEAFSARTLPIALSVVGVITSILLLVLPEQEEGFIEKIKGLNWKTAFALFASMSIYGALFQYLGFFISTFLFLNAGFWIMGERRIVLMLTISITMIVSFWFFLNYLLGIYINPGILFNTFLVPQ